LEEVEGSVLKGTKPN